MAGRINVFKECNSICIDSSAYAEAFFNLIGQAGQTALDRAIERIRRWTVLINGGFDLAFSFNYTFIFYRRI
jgi:hypothetical protein